MGRGDRFKRRALKRGYKVDEVDEFLDRAEATLAGEAVGDSVTPEDVRDIVFRTRWGGYDEWQVDLHLDRLERELADYAAEQEVARNAAPLALPPAARDQDRYALPAGQPAGQRAAVSPPSDPGPATHIQPAVPPAAPPANVPPAAAQQPSGVGGAAVPPPTSPAPETSPAAPMPGGQESRTGHASAAAPLPGSNSGPQSPEQVPAERSKFADSFADLAQANEGYRDPFADHTPKPSVAESFGGAEQQPVPKPPTPQQATPQQSAPLAAEPPAASSASVSTPQPDVQQPHASLYGGRHGKTDMTVELPSYNGDISPFTNDDKARLAEMRSQFKTRRFGSGYQQAGVDQFFDAVRAAMDGQATTDITDADFDPSQFHLVQGGYFEEEVEHTLAFLKELFARRMGS